MYDFSHEKTLSWQQGQHLLLWRAPYSAWDPAETGAGDSYPTLSVDGGVPTPLMPAFTPVAVQSQTAPDVLALGAALTLTADFGRLYGDAFIWGTDGTQTPVRIAARPAPDRVQLAEPLRYALPAQAYLVPAVWGHVFSMPPEPTRTGARYTPVQYHLRWGGAGQAGRASVETGTLNLVHQVFSTGLSDATLRDHYPELMGYAQPGQGGLDGAVWRSYQALRLRVRHDLAGRGEGAAALYEDDLSGGPFLAAHAAMAAAEALDSVNPERSALLRARAEELYTPALHSAWLDVQRSGRVSDGDVPGQAGLGSTHARLPWAQAARTFARPWKLGERR